MQPRAPRFRTYERRSRVQTLIFESESAGG